jgi:hypothetical protein
MGGPNFTPAPSRVPMSNPPRYTVADGVRGEVKVQPPATNLNTTSLGSGVVGIVTAPAPSAPTPLLTSIGNGVVGMLADASHPAPAVPDGVAGVAGTSSIHYGVMGITSAKSSGVYGQSTDGNGVHGQSTDGDGVYGYSLNDSGVMGRSGTGGLPAVDPAGVVGTSSIGYGVAGISSADSGVYAESTSGAGVEARGAASGVQATSTSGIGVQGSSASGTGVNGTSLGTGTGVTGQSIRGIGIDGLSAAVWPRIGIGVRGTGEMRGVVGESVDGSGVSGHSTNGSGGSFASDADVGVYGRVGPGPALRPAGPLGVGVIGESGIPGGTGVRGQSDGGAGVYGVCENSVHAPPTMPLGVGVCGTTFFAGGAGVEGISSTGPGVYGVCENPDPNSPKRFGGYFEGGIRVVNGPKNFAIDHPLDPQNKYLVHTCVESSEMKNIYDGDARLDKDGAAWVELPEWFEALNGDFRYQLTPIGGSAPNLHIAEEISENRFKIAGGAEGMKICWQVTGCRTDPWAAANPFEVEQDKGEEDRGRYLDPSLYGAPDELRVMPVAVTETVDAEQQAPDPSGIEFVRLEEEHRRRINELFRPVEELRRVIEQLRRMEQQEEAFPEST